MDIKRLYEQIDSMTDEYLKFYLDVINIESPTDYKPGVDAVGEYFAKNAKRLGFKVEYNYQKVSGNALCITMNDGVQQPAVCLSGHMDTVHPLGCFGSPAARIEDGIVHGPGSVDCKGGIVCAFMAMDALSRLGYKSRPIKLILQSDEENSSASSNKTTIDFMCDKAKDALCFLNVEGSTKDTLTTERKGIMTYEFTVYGISTHVSNCLSMGANAIFEACKKIEELESYKDKNFLVISCDTISGGTATNTIPELCKFTADIRFNLPEDMEKAEEIIKNIAQNAHIEGTTCEYRLISSRSPMPKTDANQELFEKIRKLYIENGFHEVTQRKMAGGSDAAYTTLAGIPTVDSIGIRGYGGGHTLKEAAKIEELIRGAKRLAMVTALIE